MNEVLGEEILNEDEDELLLRPKNFNEYVGQDDLTNNLKIFCSASLRRNETLDHCLFYGPPGLGKTTLAHVISNMMKGEIKVVSGPAIEKSGDLAAILATLTPGDILFIDEIHRLPKVVEEVLYSSMEDFKISLVVGKDESSRAINIDLPPFTLIGATTRVGDLTSPLRDRFGIISKLEYYSIEDLVKIVKRTARVFNFKIDDEAAFQIAKRSRGTPRIANRLFKRTRDFATYENLDKINLEITLKALDALKVDSLGLDYVDIAYLKGIIKRFKGGPVGIDSIASAIGEETTTLEDVYEPFLIQIGLVNRTPRGRVATKKAYKHLKIDYQNSLI